MSNQYTYSVPFTKEQLASAYHELGMSQAEIALEYNTTQKVVWKAMKKFGIETRTAAKRGQGLTKAAGYAAFRRRLESLKYRPRKCEVCGTTDASKTYDWASVTGKYDDPADYKRMCRSCLWKTDRKLRNANRRKRAP